VSLSEPQQSQPGQPRTEREIRRAQRAEEALRASEQRFPRLTPMTASDWLWETGPDHSFTRSRELTPRGIDPPPNRRERWDFDTDVEEESRSPTRPADSGGGVDAARGELLRDRVKEWSGQSPEPIRAVSA